MDDRDRMDLNLVLFVNFHFVPHTHLYEIMIGITFEIHFNAKIFKTITKFYFSFTLYTAFSRGNLVLRTCRDYSHTLVPYALWHSDLYTLPNFRDIAGCVETLNVALRLLTRTRK